MDERRRQKQGNTVHWLWLFVALFMGVTGTAVAFALSNRVQPAPIVIVPPEPAATEAPSPTPSPLTVFVNGAVVSPGLVEIPADGRMQDAIQAADGFTDEANTTIINLAQPLHDGVQIHVPTIDEGETDTAVTDSRAIVIEAVPAESSSNESGMININSATAAELESLPGVGPSTAQKIITHRQENGDFPSIDAIMDVTGIGEAKFAAMSALITVEE